MPEYEVYMVGPNGRVPKPATIFVCKDDQALTREVQELAATQALLANAGFTLEIWDGERHVLNLPSQRRSS